MPGGGATVPIEGEARLRLDGGLAYFPGLAHEQVLRFRDLPADRVEALVRCADEACFFDQPDRAARPGPDARTYTLRMTIAERSHEARFSEPIADPALARLVSTIRQLLKPAR